MNKTSSVTESDILADVIAADRGDLSPEVARSVLGWRFSRRVVTRINRLARSNRDGTISALERQELEKYLRVGSLINILQAKARLSLKSSGESGA